jgi:hypothetical protein
VYAKNVKVIEEEAFMGSNISTMKFLNGSNIEIIHKNAFKGCSNLKEVNIRNCKKIHNTAFEACGNINKITISISKEAVEKGLRFYQIFSKNLNRFNKDYSKLRHVVIYTNQGTIPTSYFEGCTNLESITIVGIIDQLGEKVFKDCVNLEKIVMDNKLQKISKETFKNCDKLSSNFEFSNVELIEESAFENCNKLTQVVFLRKINKIEKSAFKNCSTLNELEMDFIGDQLAEDSFNNCSSLTNYDFLKNVTEINSYALANMNFSNEFKWPVNLEKIHKNAFYKSTFGKELVFPSNVDIEDLAFCNTKGYEVLEMGLVKIPSEKFLPHKYFSSSISEFNANFSFIKYLKITSGIVLESQFAGWENITKVIFTKTIKKIEDSTFENCINLEAILFSNDDYILVKKHLRIVIIYLDSLLRITKQTMGNYFFQTH